MSVVTRITSFFIFSFSAAIFTLFAQTFSIDPEKNIHAINPYIYGMNTIAFTDVEFALAKSANWGAERLGGNRMTGYNWENNFSNAGLDYQQSSDEYLMGSPVATDRSSAGVVKTFLNRCAEYNRYPIIQLQMAGYVSADKNGSVSSSQTAPSSRWKKVEFKKNSSLSLEPDLNDNNVYMDELVNVIVNKYKKADDKNPRSYCLDNEPALWKSTHPYIRKEAVTFTELLDYSTELSKSIKALDPSAYVIGFETFGWSEMESFKPGGTGYDQYKNNYDWAISAFLGEMKKRSDTFGKRLIDAIGIHWYPEATGDKRITLDSSGGTENTIQARLQAPRSLWDTLYKENSWITSSATKGPIMLLPRLQKSIDKYYPGTKLAITEWRYGGEQHFSGGLATADALGIFGVYNLHAATIHEGVKKYSLSGFKLFRNFDGQSHAFGNVSVSATSPDKALYSIYASLDSNHPQLMNIIVINKKNQNVPATITIGGSRKYSCGITYGFDDAGSSITLRTAISSINNNSFTYTLPKYSALHFILSTESQVKFDSISRISNNIYNEKNSRIVISQGNKIVYAMRSPEMGGELNITLSDLTGRKIADLYSGQVKPETQISLSLSQIIQRNRITSGMYLIQASTPSIRNAQRIIIP